MTLTVGRQLVGARHWGYIEGADNPFPRADRIWSGSLVARFRLCRVGRSEVGDEVRSDTPVVLEAMTMEHPIGSPYNA